MLPRIWNPWPSLLDIGSPTDGFFASFAWLSPRTIRTPSVDIFEDEKNITVRADLPGMDPKDIKLTVEDHHMTLKGERRAERKDAGENAYWNECFYGSFSRTFHLPDDVDTKRIKARLKNGVLEITLPKRAEPKPKKIPVRMN